MRKLFAFFAFLLLISCLNEKNVDPGSANTFVRYYSGGNNDQAQGLEQTSDGFIILANTKIQKAEADLPSFKVKLIKTDQNGNPLWIKLFPAIDVKDRNYVASHMQLLPSGGYVVVGDVIKSDGTKAFMMIVDENGALVDSTSYGTQATQLRGKAVAINGAGNFLLLSTSGPQSMFLTEINKSTLQPINNGQQITYEAGNTNLANRLFVDESGKVVWSGVVTKSALTGIRMIKTIPNNVNTEFDLLISNPGFSEVGTDFCRFGNAYAVIGSTNQKGTAVGTDTDIMFKRMSADGAVLSSKSFPFGDGTTPDGQNDIGNSISSTQDGGLILLSSVNSTALTAAGIGGRGDADYYLIKINAFGDTDWVSAFGSRFKDDGVSVRQTPDGGYAVLGTTTQGALKLVTLVKTDKQGKMQ